MNENMYTNAQLYSRQAQANFSVISTPLCVDTWNDMRYITGTSFQMGMQGKVRKGVGRRARRGEQNVELRSNRLGALRPWFRRGNYTVQ